MTIPNWLIPAGECLFSGNETQLRAAIGAAAGKAQGENRFAVTLGGGAASFRFKMQTVFRCVYAKAPGGLAITWQAWPAPAALAFFAALAVFSLLNLFGGKWEAAFWSACLLGLLVFLYAIQRGTCVEQFAERFSSGKTKGDN